MLCSLFGRCTMKNERDTQELVPRSALETLGRKPDGTEDASKGALVDLHPVGGAYEWWVVTWRKPEALTRRLPVCYGSFVLSYAQSHLYALIEAIQRGGGLCMYFDTDGVACAFPPGVTAEAALGLQADGGWINEDGAFGCVKSEWPPHKYGWPRAFYALGPKTYCADFGDAERTSLDGKTHVKMKGTGLGGNENRLGPATFEQLVRKQLKELPLHKFCMDRPNDFSVTAAEGTFSLHAELSDKRCDVGYAQWHGCELLVTRPWTARDYDDERGHPLCVPSFGGACAICTEPLGTAAGLTHLGCCGRNFHAACLARWHAQQREQALPPSCPHCRAAA